MTIRILTGDCKTHMAAMEEHSIDSVVCDPPYMLNFMGKEFDSQGGAHRNPQQMQRWHESWAREAYRVLRPGGYLLAFGGTRTSHRLVCAIEDAGFEIRDTFLYWGYGSGFPKSHNVNKAGENAGRICVCETGRPLSPVRGTWPTCGRCGLPVLPEGLGSALKPSYEPICVARKPLAGTLLDTVLQYGTGALNIDGCRVGTEDIPIHGYKGNSFSQSYKEQGTTPELDEYRTAQGRWPPNVILDEHAAAALDAMSGERRSAGHYPTTYSNSEGLFGAIGLQQGPLYADTGGASRFMKVVQSDALPIESGDELRFKYTAKAGRRERNKGLDGMPEVDAQSTGWSGESMPERRDTRPGRVQQERPQPKASNHHPTVKPLDLMQWLCRLVTPPGGTVLDPFMGSGATMIAADREGFHGIGIEMDAEYAEIARRRIQGDAPLFSKVAD